MNGLALVADGLTHFANDRRELLEVVLEEIKLRVIVLLDAIESIAVLGANLVNMLIHELDVGLVFVLGLARSQLSVG